jgi:hypothetical protein
MSAATLKPQRRIYMENRKITFLGVLIMLMASLACAQQYDSETDFKVETIDNGKSVMITKYLGSKQVVRIPPQINKLLVTSIGREAFAEKQLTSVTIPNSVTSIGDWAFAINQLTSVIIPNSVTSIKDGAFQENRLTDVTIPNSVTSIGFSAFLENQLTSVIIPNSVTSIEGQVFSDNKLVSVIIPNSVTSIGRYAFFGNQLTSVTIPSSVTSIEDGAFRNNKLISVTIPSSITSIEDGVFAENQLTSVTIPNSVTSIVSTAFHENQLTSVIIPSSVTSIGNWAFSNNKLTSVTIPNSVTSIGREAFANNQLTNVTIPNSVTSIGENAFAGNRMTNNVIVLDGKNRDIDEVVKDLVLDRNTYNTKRISIRDAYYNFGTNSDAVSFAGANPWFDDSETYGFEQTQTMRSHNFRFWFHPSPSDREGRRYMLDLNARYYSNTQKVNMIGCFYVVQLPGIVVLVFTVESVEIVGKKYEGVLPATVLDPTHYMNSGKRIF